MRILLVEPEYYTIHPPLGLLKLSSYHKSLGDTTELVQGLKKVKTPERIYITSLFTWAWKPVWDAVRFYKQQFPKAEVWLGGLYASLLPDHAIQSGADCIYIGIFREAEDLMPDYALVPEWDASLIFASRGCNRNCPYCVVPKLEGKISATKPSIKHLVYPKHRKIIFLDNNILQSPYWRDIFEELRQLNYIVDFNQGLDASLITDEVARELSSLRLRFSPRIRLGYDRKSNRQFVKQAIERLQGTGIRANDILVYTLYNFNDSPQDLFERVKDILEWGAVCYPMRYQPITGPQALKKDSYIASGWTVRELDMVRRARAVWGTHGAFPPRAKVVEKITKARSFEEAFSVIPKHSPKWYGIPPLESYFRSK